MQQIQPAAVHFVTDVGAGFAHALEQTVLQVDARGVFSMTETARLACLPDVERGHLEPIAAHV